MPLQGCAEGLVRHSARQQVVGFGRPTCMHAAAAQDSKAYTASHLHVAWQIQLGALGWRLALWSWRQLWMCQAALQQQHSRRVSAWSPQQQLAGRQDSVLESA